MYFEATACSDTDPVGNRCEWCSGVPPGRKRLLDPYNSQRTDSIQ